MRKPSFILAGLALTALAAGAVWAQHEGPTYPPAFDFGEEWMLPEISGEFNPMRVTTEDVAWDGSGSVAVPFTVNQRGTAFLAIYEIGNTTTGERGTMAS